MLRKKGIVVNNKKNLNFTVIMINDLHIFMMHVFAPEIPQIYLSLFNSQQKAKQNIIIIQHDWTK